jgi:hypothetical protein
MKEDAWWWGEGKATKLYSTMDNVKRKKKEERDREKKEDITIPTILLHK